MTHTTIKKIIIIMGLAISCKGFAAHEADLENPKALAQKISPRQAHARHAKEVRAQRYNARQNEIENWQKGRERSNPSAQIVSREQSNLSTQIVKSVRSWYMDNKGPESALFQADLEQAGKKVSLHEELLAKFIIEQAFEDAPESTQAFSELSE